MPKNLIVCTGFDVFKGHEDKNASWEAVKLLPDSVKFNNRVFEVQKLLVKVEYEAVDEVVPQIWEKDPALVVHCGVSHLAKGITLEACSYNLNYCKPDYSAKCIEGSKACLSGNGKDKQILLTTLDVHKIAEELNGVEVDGDCCRAEKPFVCSKDVGNYLCGYIYLKSLDRDQDRSLFVHVPKINEPLSSEETSSKVLQVIHKCLESLEDSKLL